MQFDLKCNQTSVYFLVLVSWLYRPLVAAENQEILSMMIDVDYRDVNAAFQNLFMKTK